MIFLFFLLFQFSETVEVDYVLFNVKVFDKDKNPVLGLKKNDFELFIDLFPVKIEHFSLLSTEPQSILIMLDCSGSMGTGDLWEKAKIVLEEIEKNLKEKDEVGLFIFQSDSYRLIKSFEEKGNLTAFLNEIKPWGKTALYDALYYSSVYFNKAKNKNKRIILITDTHDNFSKEKPEKVINSLIKTAFPCHIFGLKQTEMEPLEIEFLKFLSKYTNGSIHIVSRKEDITKEVEYCIESFSKEYLIGFAPDSKSMVKYHTVLVSTKKGYTVETRKGYYGKMPKK